MIESLFNDGIYEHKKGIKIMVKEGTVFILSEEIPLAFRTLDILNAKAWRKLDG